MLFTPLVRWSFDRRVEFFPSSTITIASSKITSWIISKESKHSFANIATKVVTPTLLITLTVSINWLRHSFSYLVSMLNGNSEYRRKASRVSSHHNRIFATCKLASAHDIASLLERVSKIGVSPQGLKARPFGASNAGLKGLLFHQKNSERHF